MVNRHYCSPNLTHTILPPSLLPVSSFSLLQGQQQYKFERVFGPNVKNKEVYDTLAQPLVRKLLDPEPSQRSLLTLGATGSGKTYSLVGSLDDYGLLPLMVDGVLKNLPPGCVCRYEPVGEMIHLVFVCVTGIITLTCTL